MTAPRRDCDRRRWLCRWGPWVFGAAMVVAGVLIAPDLWARVGGGHSYSGSGHSGGGGGHGSRGHGGGGDGALVYMALRLLLWLCLEHPAVGIPLSVLLVVGSLVYRSKMSAGSTGRFASGSAAVEVAVPRRKSAAGLQRLRQTDPNFSVPLFMDFLRLLYVRVHTARGTGDFAPVRPYVSSRVSDTLGRNDVGSVSDIIVGAARIEKISSGSGRDTIVVMFEANFTEARKGDTGIGTRLYTMERWRLGRKAGVLSKGPKEITALDCPSCGSPVALTPNGACTACGQVVTNGDFHWRLEAVSLLQKQPPAQMPVGGSGGGREYGLDRPTVFQPGFGAARKTFALRYPDFTWVGFTARVRVAFLGLNESWSTKRWQLARPYETDALFDTHRYWIERYKRSGLTNRVEQVEILEVIPVKIDQDAFFDAITVRIHAKMLDYTVRDAGAAVVDGSKTTPREFSEYWTFIRRAGFGATKVAEPSACPSCGAPLDVTMTGECTYCKTLVTTGEFDWVLSAIDQDEDYRG